MDKSKDFSNWRAEQLAFVYFSRLKNLIIQETQLDDQLFDYIVDIAEDDEQTGRLFGIEAKDFEALGQTSRMQIPKYRNISFPALYVLFDTKKDIGFYKWIQEPLEQGKLMFDESTADIKELNNDNMHTIVNRIKNWYEARA